MPRKSFSLRTPVIASVFLVISCASESTPSGDDRSDSLFAAWNRADSPGCGIGVSQNGAVVYERGYGMASLERDIPIETSTVFPLASITKPFTAMSVLLAAEKGLLSLDDDVSKYLPKWSTREHVTIRHVLTHTSGLRDAFLLQGWATHFGTSTEAFVEILSRQTALNFAPGAEYQYNNGGYLLLGKILERASGQTLGAFADANIFKPLGMKDAYFNGDPVRTAPDHASGYSPQSDGWRLVPESSGYAGNGGMMSSVRDLMLWANNFAEVRVGTPELLTRMHTPGVLTNGQATQSGMGFGIGSYRGARALRTSGGDLGIATELLLLPDQKAAIAVLCNMDSVVMGGLATVNVTELTNALADIFFDDVLEPRSAPPSAGAPEPAPVNLSVDELAGKTGLYRVGSDENYIVSMSVREGSLTAWDFWGDNYAMRMTPIGLNRFSMASATLEFSPAEAARGPSWHVLDGGGQRLIELQSTSFDVPTKDLAPFAGDYRSEELDVTFAVALRGSNLVVQSTSIQPIAKDAFVGDYLGVVRFFRDARGVVAGFTLNRNGARGVRFERVKRT